MLRHVERAALALCERGRRCRAFRLQIPLECLAQTWGGRGGGGDGVVGALERDVELGAVRIRLAVLEQGGQADGLLDVNVVAWRVPLDDDVGRRDLGR